MNKKTVFGLFFCMLLLLMVVGCSKTSTSTAEKTATQTAAQQNNAFQDSVKPDTNVGNNGQTAPDLFGQVTNVSDSNITLAVAEMPQKLGASTPPPPNSQANANNTEPSAKQPVFPKLTGETQTITIPAGVKIMTGGKDNSQEIKISSIKTGDMLQVWFKDAQAKDTVKQVRIMQTPSK